MLLFVFKRLRKFGRLGLIPVISWLFLQLAMTGLFLPASASAGADWAKAGFPNTIIICTSTGLKRVVLNDDGTLPQDAPGQENTCPWCTQFGNFSPIASPATWQAAYLVFAGDVLWASHGEIHSGQTGSVQYYSRAPPFRQQS